MHRNGVCAQYHVISVCMLPMYVIYHAAGRDIM